jgi:hypothetical protein
MTLWEFDSTFKQRIRLGILAAPCVRALRRMPLSKKKGPPLCAMANSAMLGQKTRRQTMKRYLIFAAVGPFLGGFLMLVATTYASGYWTQTSAAEVTKLFVVFGKTLQFAYLFGIVPALMIGAVDDILFHVRRIGWVTRMLIVGAIAFAMAELIYGGLRLEPSVVQFILYGLPGMVPALVASWLSHKYAEPQPQPAV